jgi:hypothetical protein
MKNEFWEIFNGGSGKNFRSLKSESLSTEEVLERCAFEQEIVVGEERFFLSGFNATENLTVLVLSRNAERIEFSSGMIQDDECEVALSFADREIAVHNLRIRDSIVERRESKISEGIRQRSGKKNADQSKGDKTKDEPSKNTPD